MSKINRHNYEIYLIDYFDGKINAAEESELMTFLKANPDLKKEFEEFELVKLPAENISYHKKEDLKKSLIKPVGKINEKNYEEHFIAYHEGDLTKQEEENLQEFLHNNPSLEKDFQLYKKSVLSPQENITYRKKQDLKKWVFARRKIVYYSSAIAASILLILGIFSLIAPEKMSVEERLANQLSRINTTKSINNIEKGSHADVVNISMRKIKQPADHTFTYLREELALNAITPLSLNSDINSDIVEEPYPLFVFQRYTSVNIYELHTKEYYAQLEKRDKSLAGKIISNAFNGITSVFSKRVDEIYDNNADKLNIWNIAEAGIEGYNVLTDRDVKLYKHYNNKGEVIGFALLGDNIEYYRKLK